MSIFNFNSSLVSQGSLLFKRTFSPLANRCKALIKAYLSVPSFSYSFSLSIWVVSTPVSKIESMTSIFKEGHLTSSRLHIRKCTKWCERNISIKIASFTSQDACYSNTKFCLRHGFTRSQGNTRMRVPYKHTTQENTFFLRLPFRFFS